MAASLVGSAHKVMVIMKSSEADFREYCEGRKELSQAALDRLIALIIRELDLPQRAGGTHLPR
jgi:hypothetical protein